MEYTKVLENARTKHALRKNNYWMYINKNSGDIKFKNKEKKENNWIGYFVEDDSRLIEILRVAENKIKRIK